jgi:adenine-specific DNA-methyltransferase
LEAEIKELDVRIKAANKEARLAVGLQTKVDAMKMVRELEAERTRKRRSLFEEQDRIERQRNSLLEEAMERTKQEVSAGDLFVIRWGIR